MRSERLIQREIAYRQRRVRREAVRLVTAYDERGVGDQQLDRAVVVRATDQRRPLPGAQVRDVTRRPASASGAIV